MIAARIVDPPRRRRRRTVKLPTAPPVDNPLWATQDVPLVSLVIPAESLAGTQDIPLGDLAPAQDRPLVSFPVQYQSFPAQDQPLASFAAQEHPADRSFHNPWSFEAAGPEVVLFSTNDFSSSDGEAGVAPDAEPEGVVVFKSDDWSDEDDRPLVASPSLLSSGWTAYDEPTDPASYGTRRTEPQPSSPPLSPLASPIASPVASPINSPERSRHKDKKAKNDERPKRERTIDLFKGSLMLIAGLRGSRRGSVPTQPVTKPVKPLPKAPDTRVRTRSSSDSASHDMMPAVSDLSLLSVNPQPINLPPMPILSFECMSSLITVPPPPSLPLPRLPILPLTSVYVDGVPSTSDNLDLGPTQSMKVFFAKFTADV